MAAEIYQYHVIDAEIEEMRAAILENDTEVFHIRNFGDGSGNETFIKLNEDDVTIFHGVVTPEADGSGAGESGAGESELDGFEDDGFEDDEYGIDEFGIDEPEIDEFEAYEDEAYEFGIDEDETDEFEDDEDAETEEDEAEDEETIKFAISDVKHIATIEPGKSHIEPLLSPEDAKTLLHVRNVGNHAINHALN